jgi:hypothetical protein
MPSVATLALSRATTLPYALIKDTSAPRTAMGYLAPVVSRRGPSEHPVKVRDRSHTWIGRRWQLICFNVESFGGLHQTLEVSRFELRLDPRRLDHRFKPAPHVAVATPEPSTCTQSQAPGQVASALSAESNSTDQTSTQTVGVGDPLSAQVAGYTPIDWTSPRSLKKSARLLTQLMSRRARR